MNEPATLLEVLTSRAAEAPDREAYRFLGERGGEESRLTRGDLWRAARGIGAWLQTAGASGERALLLYPPGLDFVTAFFGCLAGGAVAVPSHPPSLNRPQERLRSIVEDCTPRVVLTTSALLARREALIERVPALAAAQWVATGELPAEWEDRWEDPLPTPATVAFLQYTSGSTRSPKGVVVSHGNLVRNEEMIRRAFAQSPESVVVSWLPLYHDMGLIGGVLQPLFCGGRCVLMSPLSFLQQPVRWLEAISRHRATTSGGPDFAYDLCARRVSEEQKAALDLSCWQVAFSGAEPVRAETLDRFARAFAGCGFRSEALYPCYGLAEATLFVSGGVPGRPPAVQAVAAEALERHRVVPAAPGAAEARRLVGCGGAWMDGTVAVVDPGSGAVCPPDQVGEIWVSGGHVAAGYWGRPEETERDFGARLSGSGDGPFLRTGDLGFVAGGELFVTGRLKDLIILRGRNLYPQDLERTAEESHPLLRPGSSAVFAVDGPAGEGLVALLEVAPHARGDLSGILAAVRRALAEEHDVVPADVVLLRAGTILKTSSGKIRRAACRSAWERGELAVLARGAASGPTDAAGSGLARETLRAAEPEERPALVEGYLRGIVAARVGAPPASLDPEAPLSAAGLDSLAAAELRNEIEGSLGIRLSAAVLLTPTLAQLAREVAELLTAAPETADGGPQPGSGQGDERLSHGQEALWFLQRLAPESPAYHIGHAARLLSPPDAPALGRAFAALAARHPALRTVYFEDREGVRQRAIDGVGIVLRETEAAGWGDAEVTRHVEQEIDRPFDLARGPAARALLLRGAAGGDVLVFTVHHIAADLWSLSILVEELGCLYAAETGCGGEALPPLPLTYGDFVAWQRARLAGEEGLRQREHWLHALAGDLPALELPLDRPRPPRQTWAGGAVSTLLTAEASTAIAALARSEATTPYTVLLTAFQALLHRLTGQGEVLVGSPLGGRSHPSLAGIVGYFVNPVVLRGRLAGEPSFRRLVGETREQVLGALAHPDYPFRLLAEELQPERDASRSPIFQAMFVLLRTRGEAGGQLAAHALGLAGAALGSGGLVLAPFGDPQRTSQFDVTLEAAEWDGRTGLRLIYNRDLFDPATAQRMLGRLCALLEAVAADPGRRVSDLPLLAPVESHQILLEWNETFAAIPPAGCLHELFEDQVDRAPEAVACIAGLEQTTYRELEERANRLASHLLAMGVVPEDRIAVCQERSPDLLVSILGVLKAGAAYVPLEPTYPRDRIRFMLEDAGATLLITTRRALPDPPELQPPVLLLDAERSAIASRPAARPRRPATPEGLAYVIYTSGSTGWPKGIAIRHHSPVAFVRWSLEVFTPADLAMVLAATSVCFDLSIFEIFVPLACGGCVVLADNALAMPRLPAAARLTLINTVPSAMAELVRSDALPDGVRVVNLAGEPLPGPLVRQIASRRPAVRIYNLYGPSEDTTYSTFARIDPEEGRAPAIGRPVAKTRAYLLDAGLRPVPMGVRGEIALGGDGLARGYLGRPALTAERFVPSPFGEPGGRLYRTGDHGRYLADGRLDFLGRGDHQVKVRGFRIELGEIEAVLADQPGVEACVVVVRDRGAAGPQLVAFYAAGEGGGEAELRLALQRRLPDYMVPSVLVRLPALPLTPNGKVDRAALPELALASRDGAAAAAASRLTPMEEVLAAIWSELLGVSEVSADDRFFDSGGHSLLAARLVTRIRHALGVELEVPEIFAAPRLSDLAARVEAASRTAPVAPETPLPCVPRGGDLALSFQQERLWFFDQLQPGSPLFNVPFALDLQGPLEVPALLAALDALVLRHETLRTTFVAVDGRPVQKIAGRGACELRIEDLASVPVARRAEEAALRTAALASLPFDLAQGPLLRCLLLRLGEAEHRLVIVLHHIICDGWSLGVFFHDLAALYAAGLAGREAALPALPVQYADYAAWQRERLRGERLESDLAYWRQRLAGAPALLELPLDRPRPAVQSFRGATQDIHLPEDLYGALRALARREEVTSFMVFLALFQTLLLRWSGQEDLVVGAPIAGRDRLETEGLIGLLANLLALRVDLAGDPAFRTVLKRVREAVLGGYLHQDLPFERLVEELQPQRDLGHAPVFQVAFTLETAPPSSLQLGGLETTVARIPGITAKYDLTLTLREEGGGLAVTAEYATDLFDGSTATRVLDWFGRLAAQATLDAERALSRLDLLSALEEQQVLREWSGAAAGVEEALWIPAQITAWAVRTPTAAAVTDPEGVLTYGDLELRSEALARHLRRLGVDGESVVAVCLPRSRDLVLAQLAILKAGGAYLPLDPESPPERSRLMLEDAAAWVLITRGGLADGLPVPPGGMVQLDLAPLAVGSGELTTGLPDALAYVIYTSGSTGRPKGVAVPHRGLTNLCRWHCRTYGLGPADRVSMVASPSFDASVWEIWPALAAGAGLHVPPDEIRIDPAALASWMVAQGIRVGFVPTPLAEAMLDLDWPGEAPRALLTGGDTLRRGRPAGLAVFNHYGPTECSVVATQAAVPLATGDAIHLPPIGRPVTGCHLYLLDRALLPVPPGALGELYLGGVGLARGYLGRPDLTAERFLPDPWSHGGRLYRTGDLGRHRLDGNVEFCGRADHQVKIRGVRIELGEVEAVLRQHPAVEQAAAVVVRQGGDPRLAGYVVPRNGAVADLGREVRAWVQERLPSAMVPAAVIVLAALPLTPSGKLDRRALPVPLAAMTAMAAMDAVGYLAPRNELEQAVAALWQDLLRVERIGVHDDFFELGGHSLLVAQVASRLHDSFGVNVAVRDLFEHPTIAGMSLCVVEEMLGHEDQALAEELLVQAERS